MSDTLSSHKKVIIIGGGVAGCSCLYHLAKRGMTDALLLEKNELTSGSTWHAAGNIPTFSTSRNIVRMQKYSVDLYDKLGEEVGYPMNYHQTGAIRLAPTQDRLEEFKHVDQMARAMGLDYKMLEVDEIKDYHPFLETHGLTGALWDPHDGDIDPSQLTQALAKGARDMGAEIMRFTTVIEVRREKSHWLVITDKGEVTCDTIVNAGGYRGAEVTAMSGAWLPVVSMEHQYLVTEAIDKLTEFKDNVPLVRDPDASYYLRREGNGLILGPYEWDAKPHWEDGKLPDDFAYQLYNDDLDRLEWYIENAIERMPILGEGGIQRVINGPIPYAPDGLPYIGPAHNLPNYFHCCSFSFGICQGGGAGKIISEWVLDGRPQWDMWSVDPRRYTSHATQQYVVDKAIEVYQNEYAIAYPNEFREAGRPAKMSGVYGRLQEKGARFGAYNGWERALWFPREGDEATEKLSYHHTNWFDTVAKECKAVNEAVGVLDLGGFSKFLVTGNDAESWLDGMIAGNLPKQGRITLSYFCHESGGVWSEVTITRLADNAFYLISAGAAEWHDLDWMQQNLSADLDVNIVNQTSRISTLVIAGPKSRDVVAAITKDDISNKALPWLSAREISIGFANVRIMRVNYVGELGYELHVPSESALAVYDALWAAGEAHGIIDFGMFAMDSMRLEKGYRGWKTELDHEYSPLRSGLDRFVNLEKQNFTGKDAMVAENAAGLPDIFVAMTVSEGSADALYGCTISIDGEMVGYTTSGGYGHRIGSSIALGYVNTAYAQPGVEVMIDILGEQRAATIVADPIYDPQNQRLRG